MLGAVIGSSQCLITRFRLELRDSVCVPVQDPCMHMLACTRPTCGPQRADPCCLQSCLSVAEFIPSAAAASVCGRCRSARTLAQSGEWSARSGCVQNDATRVPLHNDLMQRLKMVFRCAVSVRFQSARCSSRLRSLPMSEAARGFLRRCSNNTRGPDLDRGCLTPTGLLTMLQTTQPPQPGGCEAARL